MYIAKGTEIAIAFAAVITGLSGIVYLYLHVPALGIFH